ncbi:hypothetical protein BDY21DRAFT_368225 [Lineolata rhizophorae]|uniref:Uncharacterized protein n=1 Tax=Lineolata rhizophorae TaxID=578093 RepID=A0A6A6PDN2_9PEZI|nr:hypothetical protein BDY21DRAFT_368225 [Lineolata rhizophorae]
MATRNVVLAIVALGTFALIWNHSSIAASFPMSAATTDSAAAPAVADLEFSLAQSSAEPTKLKVTLTNTHASSTMTILDWNTPLDPLAPNLGVVHIVNSETGKEVEIPRIMVNRKMPPPRVDLVELAPGQSETREILLEGPRVSLEKGTRYEVNVSGNYMAVWASPSEQVGETELNQLSGGTAMSGQYESEKVAFEI